MNALNRPQGRPPKVRPEAMETPTEHEVQTAIAKSINPEVAMAKTAPVAAAERMVEVELLHKYAPYGQKQEIKLTVPPGTIMKLPAAEALRALKLEIARATDRTFDV